MGEIENFSAVLEELYAAALEPDRWQKFAPLLAALFGSESCAVQLQSRSKGEVSLLSATGNFDSGALAAYQAHFYKTDIWVARGVSVGLPGIFTGQELVDDNTLLASEYYNDFCRGVGIFHLLGGGSQIDQDTIAVIGVHRSKKVSAFVDDDKRWLSLLFPHLQRALQMRRHLSTIAHERQLGFDALEALSIGAIIVSVSSEILFANRIAERLFSSGAPIRSIHGRLRSADSQKGSALLNSIRAAASGGGASPGGLISLRSADGQMLSVLVCPIPAFLDWFGLKVPGALLFISDSSTDRTPSTEALTSLHRLTRAEARLLVALASGMRVTEYAERTGITINTVNTQLKQIFAKTGYNRQTDLVRQALSDPIALMSRFFGSHH